MSVEPQAQVELDDEAWREIDQLVDQIAELARGGARPDEFYPGLLDRTVRALAAEGGAVWLATAPGQLDLEYRIGLDFLDHSDAAVQHAHHRLIAQAVAGERLRSFPPRSGSPRSATMAGGESLNPTGHLLLVQPLWLDGQVSGALELVQRPTTHPAAIRGYERLLGVVGELVLEYQRERLRRDLRRRVEFAERLDGFACRVHAALDPRAAAYEIANEGRTLIDCDRLSVVVGWDRRQRLAAISGVDLFDPRSNVVRRLERLVRRVVAAGEPFWYTGDWSRVPPELERELREYLDESHGRTLGVVPLTDRVADGSPDTPEAGPAVGALVVERFDAAWDAEVLGRVGAVARHGAVALRNAREYRSLPLLAVSRALRRAGWQFQGSRLVRSLAVIAALCVAVAVLVLVPAPFAIQSPGQLQPQLSRYIYAPENGEVRRLLVAPDQQVAADQPLLQLASTELDLELERAETQRITTNKQLESIGIQRVTGDARPDAPEFRADQLSAQELEFAQLLRSQERQIELIQRRIESLLVRSPLAGRVLTWDLEQTLQNRPVQRGQMLLRVADVAGPWQAELEVPAHRIGHVLAAWDDGQRPLAVRLTLGTDPGVVYPGTLLEVAQTASLNHRGQPVVMVKVRVEREIPQRHPGATVNARIDCGRRSLGYVWLHDLIDTVRAKLL
ncbi:MAG: efflux RND transporter periplasmic adaptor subunit [Pirellulaceae bacterium]|nr:efflux RND transporter periplasmic adaptor subunit [Pirellulaceae bacterium]